MEYCSEEIEKEHDARMNALAAEGWEMYAVTNGHHGSRHHPPAVTVYMRRPLARQKAVEKNSAERLAEARKNRGK